MQLQLSALNVPLNAPSNSNDSSNTGLRGPPNDRRAEPIPARNTFSLHDPGYIFHNQLTYSDLSDGYHRAERQPELLRIPDGKDVRLIKWLIQYVDDPDSLAIILAVPTHRPGVMRPVFGIAHRKLRYLFNDAINWSLTRDRLHFQEGALVIYTATSSLDGRDHVLAMLPEELTAVEVHTDDLNFDAPTIKFVNPEGTIHWLFYGAFAVLAGILFIELLTLSTTTVFQATMSSAYDGAVFVTARELHHFITGIDIFVCSVGCFVLTLMVQDGLRVATFFREVQENVEV